MKEFFKQSAEKNKNHPASKMIEDSGKKIEEEEAMRKQEKENLRRKGEQSVRKVEESIRKREAEKIEEEEGEEWETHRTYYQTGESPHITYADQRSNGDPHTDAQVSGVDYPDISTLKEELEKRKQAGKIKSYSIIEDASWEEAYSTPSGWSSPRRKPVAEVTI